MSYIIKSTSPFVNIKLTEKGREQLAQGKLNFSFWAIGDSEINYTREAIVDNATSVGDPTLTATTVVFKPFDKQPNLKSFIYPLTSNEIYQPVNASVINVVKAVVNNEAQERGFFSGTSYNTLTGLTYCAYNEYVSDTTPGASRYDGSNIISVSSSAFTIGDFVLIKIGDYSTGALTQNDNTVALPNLWYKIQALTAGTTSIIELDRNLPNLNGTWTGYSQIFIYKGGEVYNSFGYDNSTAYWDSGTLSFDSSSNITCNDVPVWNMNNVWCESLAGITGLTTTNLYEGYTKFGSFPYLGTKNPYLEFVCKTTADTETSLAFSCTGPGQSYLDDVSKSISILHYTNNTISNLYGEFFYTDAANNKYLSLFIPDLMYHRRNGSTGSGTTMGMRFIATGSTFTTNQDIEYIELIEDPAMVASASTSVAVGRVYPQLKTVVFYNDEIVSALSYKSNRNWTLPELSATLAAPSGGTSTGILNTQQTMYLTYVLDNVGQSGYTSSLPCQTYIKITNNTSSAKDVSFKITETDMLPYMRKIESAGYDGLGFYAYNFKLLYQIVTDSMDRPDPGAWKEYDFTSTAITTNAGETIDPKLLENQNPAINGFVLDVLKDVSATTFNLISLLNLPPTVSPEKLQFGDERFFYGNLSTYIGATIYKTIFDIRVNSSQFNATTNPTRSSDTTVNPPNIKISEVGIYDTDKNLVCIGKLSTPVALTNGNTIMLELSMDF
jgi:hypothetical protein